MDNYILHNGPPNFQSIIVWLMAILVSILGFRFLWDALIYLLLKLYELIIQKNSFL
jgi:hypothetical protein